MELALQILLSVLSLVCIGVGLNLLRKGAAHFLPQDTPVQPGLDNTFRFLSGMFFSFGFLLLWIVFHIAAMQGILYFVGLVIFCAGLGRVYSRIKTGDAGTYLDVVMVIEMLLGIATMLLQWLR